MKKIIFRKLLLDCMSFFLIALISSSIVIWVFQAVNFLDIMIEDGRDFLVYINYSLLKDLCLVLNHDETTLITLYKYTEPNYEKNYEKIA